MTLNGQTVQDLIIAIGLLGGVFVYSRTRLPRQTIKDLQEHIAAQDLRIKDLQIDRDKNKENVARLQGQLDLYKELPLRELAEGIKTIVASNAEIVSTLKGSALIASATANDGGLLVKTKANTPVTVKMEESDRPK